MVFHTKFGKEMKQDLWKAAKKRLNFFSICGSLFRKCFRILYAIKNVFVMQIFSVYTLVDVQL